MEKKAEYKERKGKKWKKGCSRTERKERDNWEKEGNRLRRKKKVMKGNRKGSRIGRRKREKKMIKKTAKQEGKKKEKER